MISLIEKPIESIDVEDRHYKLNMSFDNIIRIDEIQQNKSLADVQQLLMGARLLFVNYDEISNKQTLIEDFIHIYSEYVMKKEEEYVEYDLLGNPMPVIKEEEEDDEFNDNGVSTEYCFIRDADYIYSSFMMDYKINLHKEIGKMHWHVFLSLLNGLSDDTKFKKVLNIRQQPYPKDNASRNELEKAKKQVALRPRK